MGKIFITLNGYELEFENPTSLILFGPGIYEMEDSVVVPNPWTDFFINPHAFRCTTPSFCTFSRCKEFSILCQTSRISSIQLINELWIRASGRLWLIVALID